MYRTVDPSLTLWYVVLRSDDRVPRSGVSLAVPIPPYAGITRPIRFDSMGTTAQQLDGSVRTVRSVQTLTT